MRLILRRKNTFCWDSFVPSFSHWHESSSLEGHTDWWFDQSQSWLFHFHLQFHPRIKWNVISHNLNSVPWLKVSNLFYLCMKYDPDARTGLLHLLPHPLRLHLLQHLPKWGKIKYKVTIEYLCTQQTLSRNAVLVSIAISNMKGKVVKIHINGNKALRALFICEATSHVCRMLETEFMVPFSKFLVFH
jgi:hypothetical protein